MAPRIIGGRGSPDRLLQRERGNLDQAEAPLRESLAFARQAGEDLLIGTVLCHIASIRQDDPGVAVPLLDEAEPLLRAVGNRAMLARALLVLGLIGS